MAQETIKDANPEAASSTASSTAEQTLPDAKTTDVSSTTQTDAKKEPTLKEVIAGVLEKHEPKKESSTEEKTKEAESGVLKSNDTALKNDDKKVEEEKKDVKVIDDSKLPFHNHPRFVEVVKEKTDAVAKVKEFEPIVQRMQNVEKYCTTNNINPDDYKQSLELAALVKTNPQEAVKRLSAVVEALKQQTGESLPQDLQKKVDDGIMHIDDAKDVAKLRLQVNGQKAQAESSQKEQQHRVQNELVQSVESWKTSKVTSDPDFKPKSKTDAPDGKYELVLNKFNYYWTTTPVYSVNEAVALLDRAYNDVDASIKSFLPPPPRRTAPLKPNGHSKQEDEIIDTSKPGWARKVAAGLSSR